MIQSKGLKKFNYLNILEKTVGVIFVMRKTTILGSRFIIPSLVSNRICLKYSDLAYNIIEWALNIFILLSSPVTSIVMSELKSGFSNKYEKSLDKYDKNSIAIFFLY